VGRILGSVILVMAFSLGPAACGGGGSADSSEPTRQSDTSKGKGIDDGEEDVSGKDKEWGGWQWKGKRDDCFFVYDNRCYDDLDKACKKAGCAKNDKKCETVGGGPAEVKCSE
jgi:hypothetical protein